MSRNGSGTYSLPSGNPVVTGTTISSTTHNNTLSDIATALTQSLAYDGQTTPIANLPMGGFKFTGLGAGSAAGHSVRWEQSVGLVAAAGDLLYGSAAGTLSKLSAGIAGQVLQMNSGATAPQWASVAFTTGDVKLTIKTTADTGWVLMDDKTIGDASSGATGRANSDTSDLFTLLWTNTADAQCAVSGGRGASAAADYAAHKTIALPKVLGRALAVYGAGSGLTSRALALAIGDENLQAHTHTGTTGTESAQHTHQVGLSNASGGSGPQGVVQNPGNSVTSGTTGTESATHTHSFTSDSTGAGSAQNMQPTAFLNVMIKL